MGASYQMDAMYANLYLFGAVLLTVYRGFSAIDGELL